MKRRASTHTRPRGQAPDEQAWRERSRRIWGPAPKVLLQSSSKSNTATPPSAPTVRADSRLPKRTSTVVSPNGLPAAAAAAPVPAPVLGQAARGCGASLGRASGAPRSNSTPSGSARSLLSSEVDSGPFARGSEKGQTESNQAEVLFISSLLRYQLAASPLPIRCRSAASPVAALAAALADSEGVSCSYPHRWVQVHPQRLVRAGARGQLSPVVRLGENLDRLAVALRTPITDHSSVRRPVRPSTCGSPASHSHTSVRCVIDQGWGAV